MALGMQYVSDRPGGLNRYFEAYVQALRSEVGVLALRISNDDVFERHAHDLQVSGGRLCVFRYWAAAMRYHFKVKAVDVHFAYYGLVSALLRRITTRTSMIVHFHGPWAAESRNVDGRWHLGIAVKAIIEKFVYQSADTIFVLSEEFKTVVVTTYNVSHQRVTVVPPGVDLSLFNLNIDVPEDSSLPSSFVLCARRLERRMGIDDLIKAFEILSSADVYLLIVGSGRYEKKLRALADESLSANRIHFMGRVSDERLAELYQRALLSVVPTRAFEGFGLVTLESLASGTPVIVTNVGGLPGPIRSFDESLIVEPGNPRALANRINAALAGDVPSSTACRQYAEQFGWDVTARRTLQCIDVMINGWSSDAGVTFVDHTAVLSGAELALVELVNDLQIAPTSVLLGQDGPLADVFRQANIQVDVLKSRGLTLSAKRNSWRTLGTIAPLLQRSREISSYLSRRKPAVVYVNSFNALPAVLLATRLRKNRVAVVWHVRDVHARPNMGVLPIMLTRILIRMVDGIVANSEYTLARLRNAPTRPAVVMHSSTSEVVPRLQPAGMAASLTFIMASRIAPWKGQDIFLRAFAAAFKGTGHRARIFGEPLFGEDDFMLELRRIAETLGITEQVEFPGHSLRIPYEIAESDVLVLASTQPEPLGQVVMHGMAGRAAIVATEQGGPGELLTHMQTGLLVANRDVRAMADAFKLLDEDRVLLQSVADAAFDQYLATSEARSAERVRLLINDVLGRGTNDAR